jgi:hypothetical protein
VLGHFEGRDENGNIYTFLMPQDKQNWDIFYPTIRKYDKNGNLLSTVKQEIKRGRCPNLTLRNTMVIDKKGNIYEYCATQNGLTITKWYKQ